MKLKDKEFNVWCNSNRISNSAKKEISYIRQAEPARRVKSGRGSVSGRFPSKKMGVTIQFESHTNEFPYVYYLENSPDVLEYYDQPNTIKLDYKIGNKSNRNVLHTPDFFVIERDKAYWVECKTERDLLKLAIKSSERYKLDENQKWICPPGQQYAVQFGLNYIVRSSKEINPIFQRNLEFLDDYFRNEHLLVSEESAAFIFHNIRNEPGILLMELLEVLNESTVSSVDDLYILITKGAIYVDLQNFLLTEPEHTRLFINSELANAYSNAFERINCDQPDNKKKIINITPNLEVVWDGQALKVVNVGDQNISLMDHSDTIVPMPVELFKRMIDSGAIYPLQKDDFVEDVSKINEILLAATEKQLKQANYRADIVRASFVGLDIISAVPERTLREWKKNYRNAEQIFGYGYIGLIPQITKGNCNSKLPEISIEILKKKIVDKYQTLEQKTCSSVYLDYENECKDRNVIPASFVTFCKYINAQPQYEQTLKRKGKRAAYEYEEFYWNLEQDTPRHGERPFHITHIDHTPLDIELVDTVTKKVLGRPWLTMLIDAFTRKILAVYLTFESPSKISCMMVLRECVRRHGRLPQIIVVDGGKEFGSIYFEALLACYEITKKTRPPAESRFGSVIERLFGTAHTQFIYNLIGNTQITKNVRQVTKANNPKNRAIWTLPRLFDRLCEWAYEIYDQAEHSTLCQTPREAFAKGMLVSGKRLHRLVTFNEEFKFLTLPGTTKGYSKVDGSRGVKINKIHYWADEFRNPEVVGERVRVKYDPFDIGIAYAYVNGKWCECRSQHYRIFKRRSEREIYLATEELKKKRGGRAVTSAVLAEFLGSLEAEQLLLKQRMTDREHQAVLRIINGQTFGHENVEQSLVEYSEEPEIVGNSNVISFPASGNYKPEDYVCEDEQDDLDCIENFEVYESF